MREKVLEWIEKYKVVAIVRGAEPEQCRKMAQAIYDGGIKLLEITYDMKNPASWQTTADTIGALAAAICGAFSGTAKLDMDLIAQIEEVNHVSFREKATSILTFISNTYNNKVN